MSAFFCAALMGNANASKLHLETSLNDEKRETAHEQKAINAFKDMLSFQQQNLNILWEQYDQAMARIADQHGNDSDIDRDLAFFIGEYQKDIERGRRVEESKKAIADLKKIYAEKHALRDQKEAIEVARLQVLLKAQLDREKKTFKALKKEYGYLINEQTLPLLLQMEQQFASSSHKAAKLEGSRDYVMASL